LKTIFNSIVFKCKKPKELGCVSLFSFAHVLQNKNFKNRKLRLPYKKENKIEIESWVKGGKCIVGNKLPTLSYPNTLT
jgi:hypothetical protein